MILRAHIQYIHIHAYRYYAGRPRDPTSVPKAVLGPSFSPDGGNRAGMRRVQRPVDGNWGGHYILRSISWCAVNVFGLSGM